VCCTYLQNHKIFFREVAEANVKSLARLSFLVALLLGAVQTGFSRGDKIIPQVVDGPGWVTKFDLTNISSSSSFPITQMRLSFYKADGTKWSLPIKDHGTGSDFTLNIGARQTIRIETLGGSSQVTSGYAVIYDEQDKNSEYSEDYVLGISVFYVYSTSSGVVDTVTVTVPTPTAAANIPIQMDGANGIYSGLALVNWRKTSPSATPSTNVVGITLYSQDGTQYGTTQTITLGPSTQQEWAHFLDESLFPGLNSFKGMAQITSDGPIAILGMLQTRSYDGNVQFSTLVPVDRESLRRNTYMVLIQASTDGNPRMPVDFDNFAVDYYRNDDGTEAYSWDLEYRYNRSDRTNRYLQPDNGAAVAYMGSRDDISFDSISLPTLKGLTYSTSTLDLSGTNLFTSLAFAVRTDIGNYAKVRIVRVIDTTDNTSVPGSTLYNKDLVLEVCIYK
jgi:hypothetical protein